MIRDCIDVVENKTESFVGLKIIDGKKPTIFFPYGFSPSTDDENLRKDIISLLSIIKKFSDKNDGDLIENKNSILAYPIESYIYLIKDYLQNGYYIEKEKTYKTDTKGKINWKKTIDFESPIIDNENLVYLKFKVNQKIINEGNLITKIHKMCVYESFYLFGWLFLENNYMPSKSVEIVDKKIAIQVLKNSLCNTFNDDKKRLFNSMINILQNNNEGDFYSEHFVGVSKFDHVWERLIDYVFGEDNKKIFFPHATWYIIKDYATAKTSALIPDTIMKWQDKLFVLDSKYYRYGLDETMYNLLPQTDSIQKQITYGKHISNHLDDILPKNNIDNSNIYNAFIMPYKSKDENHYKFVSIATSDWEKYDSNSMNYLYVVGILLDIKYIISQYSKHNLKEINYLSEIIVESLNASKSYINSNQ